MAVGDPNADGPSGVGMGGMGFGSPSDAGGEFGGMAGVGTAVGTSSQQAEANAAAQAAAEAAVDIGAFGGFAANPNQVAAEAAMGLDPFGGAGNAGFMGPDGTQGMEILKRIAQVQNPQICPEGYEYDFNLNACRRITPTPAEQLVAIQPALPTAPRYARMSLLDTPPQGLLEAGFAGFGSPADFTAQNLAFRRQSAAVPTYFSDPRSYEGYTLI